MFKTQENVQPQTRLNDKIESNEMDIFIDLGNNSEAHTLNLDIRMYWITRMLTHWNADQLFKTHSMTYHQLRLLVNWRKKNGFAWITSFLVLLTGISIIVVVRMSLRSNVVQNDRSVFYMSCTIIYQMYCVVTRTRTLCLVRNKHRLNEWSRIQRNANFNTYVRSVQKTSRFLKIVSFEAIINKWLKFHLPHATFAFGSCFKWASNTASLIWSHILSAN